MLTTLALLRDSLPTKETRTLSVISKQFFLHLPKLLFGLPLLLFYFTINFALSRGHYFE